MSVFKLDGRSIMAVQWGLLDGVEDMWAFGAVAYLMVLWPWWHLPSGTVAYLRVLWTCWHPVAVSYSI